MHQVCFIAQEDPFSRMIDNALRQHYPSKMLSPSQLQQTITDGYFSRPTIVIVSLELLSPRFLGGLEQLLRAHCDTLIIPISPPGQRSCLEDFTHWGVDEILPRPWEESSCAHVVARLLQRISTCDRLAAVQEKLRKQMSENQIVAKSKPLRELMQRLPALAESSATVLITGETGTGKEVLARAIHYLGPRSGQPFVTVDCGAIPEHLIENELFGHARGAYTNAATPAKGLIAEANGGTLFLDEVEALPLPVQSKFLRFLQERQFRPLGQTQYMRAEVRILAATNLDLSRGVAQNSFRADLYYRLNVVPLMLPPLRERKADLPALVHHFLRRYSRGEEPCCEVPPELMKAWLAYDWPGNVRELENKVQAWLMLQSDTLAPASAHFSEQKEFLPLAEVRRRVTEDCERAYLRNLLAHTQGNISAAARIAGMHRKNLGALLKKHGIKQPLEEKSHSEK